jgi:4,5-DOPA dioxygenase extradiol
MPALFVGHGNPMNAIEDNQFTRSWEQAAADIPHPDAVLCISAHWVTEDISVTADEAPRTIHDFYGFPKELFKIEYPAPGSPSLAARIQDLLSDHEVVLDKKWGLDHGAWSVLMRMYPHADIPVVQLSLVSTATPAQHYGIGGMLGPLRDEGILILGTGNIVHNLREVDWRGEPYDWAVEFDTYIRDRIHARDWESIIHYERAGEAGRLAVPSLDHYLPLLCVLGTVRDTDNVSFLNESITMGSIAMRSVRVG